MFMEICFVFYKKILLIPLVISKKPVIIGLIKEVSICKMLKRGIKKKKKLCNKPLLFKIEITLEKMTTNPPISKIV